MQINNRVKREKRATLRPRILVLGGNGFIGRYTVAALQKLGVEIFIGTRHIKNNKVELEVKLHESLTEHAWETTLNGIDAVINTVGILRERKNESYDMVHHLAVGALARACKNHSIPLIHMSALGIDGLLKNDFAKSKFHGETAIVDSKCRGAIVRASIVNAPDGYGAGWMYRVAKWPVWLLPSMATKLICPIEAKDLGEALAKLALTNLQCLEKQLAIMEVGGSEVFTLKTYLQKLRIQQTCLPKKPLLILTIPSVIAKVFAKVFDVLHLTPYSIGHHELLENDNIPNNNCLAKILGRDPRAIGETAGSIKLTAN